MSEITEGTRRPVPKHIDKSERIGEILLVFSIPVFVLRAPIMMLSTERNGSEMLYLILLGFVLAFGYHKATVNQKPGFILHKGYRIGFTVRGLLNHSIKRVVK